jgi:putative lipoprotein
MERGAGDTRLVRGEIVLPAGELPDQAAEVVVQVEDVSRADAPSRVVGEQRLRRVELLPGGRLAFEIEVPADELDERMSYSVRAHVDVSGSGEVEPGDLVTTQSYPVLSGAGGESTAEEAVVSVNRV